MIAATALTLLVAGTVRADPADDKARVDKELAEAEAALEGATDRAREAGRDLAEVERLLPGARDALARAEGVLAAAQVRADTAAEEAREAQEEADAAAARFDEAQTAVEAARDDLGTSVRCAYTGQGAMALSAVFTSRSPGEVVDRLAYLDSLVDTQKGAVDAVVVARQNAKAEENLALVAKDEADAAKAEADTALADAEAAAAEALAHAQELSDLHDQRDDALRVAEEERDESLARYEELEAESERIEDMLQAAAQQDSGSSHHTPSPGGGSDSGSGSRLSMPVNGWKSSDFGMRYDPFYNVWQLHAGMDLAAGGGASIRAAASGRVVQAGWNGGYGNYTCVYHGKGLSTCYAHQSSIGVWVGQQVGRGEYIGAVGTTGASTGNHLHFEVRVNGGPVNPAGWLPSCLC